MVAMAEENIIFTSNAVVGMKLAGLDKASVLDAYRRPTKEGKLRRDRKQKIRVFEDREVGLVYRRNDFGDVVVERVWMQPVEKK
jgi:hypothetical protein